MTRPDLDSLARAWGVSLDGIPLQTKEGKLAYGVKDGQPVCLKVLGTSFDAAGSRETLERFEGQGAVAVLASCPSAVLMERLTPGTTLNKQMQTDQSLDDVRIFCATALALHGTDTALDGIPSILTWSQSFADWDQELDDRLPQDWVNEAANLLLMVLPAYRVVPKRLPNCACH